MKVTNQMIAKDMRIEGILWRTFSHLTSVKKFKRAQKIISHLKGKAPKNPNVDMQQIKIPGKDGNMIRLCVYTPKSRRSDTPMTGLLWVHGGGYAIGIPEMENTTIARIIDAHDTIVVSPDYRLSLEAPYPAAVEDVYTSLLWMKSNAASLNMNRNQIFIGGESAGGGLTCCVSALARDRHEVNIAFQMPLYPMLDNEMDTPSMKSNNAPVWNQANNNAAWKQYLGINYLSNAVSPYAAPSHLKSYDDLPPTFTFIGDIEPFYDETMAYIANLNKADVQTEVHVYHGAFHGFDRIAPHSSEAKQATAAMLKAYLAATKKYFKTNS